ncbi:hypothetical protein EUX57_23710 [Pseudomonas orientalis]|uniref:Uncharacterized protein n=1 Tax=Pseudomonas orientalis TaxID=76758 RepID=A0A4Q7CV50_9PSED|nr:hypothetical protein EUX57_23710 [Pseudomonas orientalis]
MAPVQCLVRHQCRPGAYALEIRYTPCGRGLAPDCHTYLHTTVAPNRNHDAKRAALDLAFDLDLLVILGAPLNHAGRTQA